MTGQTLTGSDQLWLGLTKANMVGNSSEQVGNSYSWSVIPQYSSVATDKVGNQSIQARNSLAWSVTPRNKSIKSYRPVPKSYRPSLEEWAVTPEYGR